MATQRTNLRCMVIAIVLIIIASAHVHAQGPTVDITSLPRCGSGGYLVQGNNDCVVNELMGSNGTLTFSFKVKPQAKHGLLLTLRSVGAEAVM